MLQTGRDLGRFYTPPKVARQLVEMIDAVPTSLVDFGCGRGALSLAATARWGRALRLVSLDVDPAAGPQTGAWADDHRHVFVELLHQDPFENVLEPESFDLAVLNPPYGRRCRTADLRPGTPRTSDGAILVPWPATRCRATIFMLHALQAVRPGGRVAAILPETLATGMGSAASRALITGYAAIERVKALSARTFPGTEARTVMVVLRRSSQPDASPTPWWPERPEGGNRTRASDNLSSLGELGVDVVRGRLSTIEARNAQAFHLSNFRAAKDGAISLPERGDEAVDERAAQAGDILVARVGRNISEKVVRVTAGSNALSDCVYRLRCPPSVIDRVWRGLRSASGKRQMEASLSGVTTRILPMGNLLTLRV